MGEPLRYFFVHVQKTAGTALLQRVRESFPTGAVYPDASDGPLPDTVILVEHLLARWRARGDEIELVSGHFPLCTVELLDAPFRTLTLLRDPVERTLSYLRHHRSETADPESTSLEEIYEDPFRYSGFIHNHMVKMFGLRIDEMSAGMLTRVELGAEHLGRAKEQLSAVTVVGLQEEFEWFCSELTVRFGWDLGRPRFANRTAPVEVSDRFRRRIAQDNELDLELYEFARALVAERVRAQ